MILFLRDDHALEATHNIFLSYSGAQAGFTEQLFVELKRLDRHPFFDKDRKYSLPIGKDFPPLLFKAIEQCQVGVVILSEEYFTRSTWPMTELATMAKRKDEGFLFIPVYLRISRSECRNLENQRRWLKTWKQWAKSDKRINIEEWKQALTLFGPKNGLIYAERSSEVKFREEIVEAVCREVPPATRWYDSDVRAKSRFCKVSRDHHPKSMVLAFCMNILSRVYVVLAFCMNILSCMYVVLTSCHMLYLVGVTRKDRRYKCMPKLRSSCFGFIWNAWDWKKHHL